MTVVSSDTVDLGICGLWWNDCHYSFIVFPYIMRLLLTAFEISCWIYSSLAILYLDAVSLVINLFKVHELLGLLDFFFNQIINFSPNFTVLWPIFFSLPLEFLLNTTSCVIESSSHGSCLYFSMSDSCVIPVDWHGYSHPFSSWFNLLLPLSELCLSDSVFVMVAVPGSLTKSLQ